MKKIIAFIILFLSISVSAKFYKELVVEENDNEEEEEDSEE